MSLYSTIATNHLITNCEVNCDTNLPNVSANQASLVTGMQLVFGVIAAATVIYIIVAGIKLMASQGDPQQIAKARQSIIYAVIGLVVCLFAEIIVTFVIGRL